MSVIIGIYGLQGWGKTWLTTYLGLRAKSYGSPLYANFTLKKVEYKHIYTIEQAQNIRNGTVLFDEFWEWVHARTSQSKINKTMMSICLKNRKRGVSIIYNSQLPRTIDIILKEVTNYRYLPQVVEHENGKKYVHYIAKDLLGNYSEENVIPFPVEYVGKYFNTYEEPNKPNENITPLEKGIDLEQDFNFVLQKSKEILFTKLQENSGNKAEYKFDILVVGKEKIGNVCFDVKSTMDSDRVSIKEHGKNLENKINSLKRWNGKLAFKPYFAFPVKEHSRTTRIENWYICSIMDNLKYFRKLNSMPRYSSLIKKSLKLKNSFLFP